MKHFNQSFFFLFFFCATFCFAQKSTDSLSYYRGIAMHPKASSDLINASVYFNEQLEASKTTKDVHTQLNSLYYLASINYKIGFYEESEKLAMRAIKILDENSTINNKKAYKKSFYNQLGVLYSEQQSYDKAVELYSRVLKVANSTKDSLIAYNNIANVYKRNNLINESHKFSVKALQLTLELKDTISTAMVLNNLGYIKTRLNDFKQGRKLLYRALELRRQLKDSSVLYSSFSNLTKYYMATDSMDMAKFYAKRALDFASKLNSASYKQNALGLLVQLSPDNYSKAYKAINDSLIAEDKARSNRFALMRYDYSEFERQALESQLRVERQRSRAIISTLVAIGVVMLSVLAFFFFRARHRKEKLQQVIITESRISKQVHDEVANNVFQIMTKFENNTYQRHSLRDELYLLYHKARDISNQHSLLDTKVSFRENLEALLESYESENTNIVVKGLADVRWDVFSDVYKNTIYKVLQELLINMKKYSDASLVLILFEKEGKKLKINYSDNGVGAELVKHTGLFNTENRIQSVGGTIIFDTQPEKGFKVKIVI